MQGSLRRAVLPALICLGSFVALPQAQAHFVYVKSHASKPGGQASAKQEAVVYFTESAHVDGHRMPSRVRATSLHVRQLDKAARNLSPAEQDRDGWVALFAELPAGEQFAIEAALDYGLHHGVMLKYRAKHLHVRDAAAYQKLGAAKSFELDVVPAVSGQQLTLTATWQGKPKAGVELACEGADGEELDLVTDDQGHATIKLTGDGLYSVRANWEQDDAKGEFQGEAYEGCSYYTTLTVQIGTPGGSAQPAAEVLKLADLPEAVSSFGGVVAGDSLYVYSGHTGTAHSHSKKNLSKNFRRLKLQAGAEWEELPVQTPLQGLPLVAYEGKVYRVGGLNARNEDPDEPELFSSDEFAAFDPATKTWSMLPKLPSPRSSHDAVVLDGKLYVVGGWNLGGDDDGEWHDDALVCDLRQQPLKWTKIPAPSQRRALAVSTHHGRIVAIGGMTSDHDIDRAVSFLDPESKKWTTGPDLPGEGMNGFGVSAWNLAGQLFVCGSNGELYRLTDKGDRWDVVGKLQTPRFFHQLVPAPQGGLLAVAGASMKTGHLTGIEFLAVPAEPAQGVRQAARDNVQGKQE